MQSTGHNSVVRTVETQLDFVLKCLKEKEARGAKTVAIRKETEIDYMKEIYNQIEGMVWSASRCSPWYADEKGRVVAIYPGNLQSYEKRVAQFDATKDLVFT
jgi:hypothetical protein